MKIDEIIQRIKSLDLSKYPEDEIRTLLNQVDDLALIVVHLSEFMPIFRGRPNGINERFEKKSDYSFKPQKYNKTYQRASTPNQTAFYGVFPNIRELTSLTTVEHTNMRIVCFSEIFHKGLDIKETPKISFGKWVVKEKEILNLLAIVQNDKYTEKNIFLKELNDAFSEFTKRFRGTEIYETTTKFYDFLSAEFSKSEIRGDYDYLISAIYSELILNECNYDGIIYPSVRGDGSYFNVVITPNAVEEKLQLIIAGENLIVKTDEGYCVENADYSIRLCNNEVEFKLIPAKL